MVGGGHVFSAPRAEHHGGEVAGPGPRPSRWPQPGATCSISLPPPTTVSPRPGGGTPPPWQGTLIRCNLVPGDVRFERKLYGPIPSTRSAPTITDGGQMRWRPRHAAHPQPGRPPPRRQPVGPPAHQWVGNSPAFAGGRADRLNEGFAPPSGSTASDHGGPSAPRSSPTPPPVQRPLLTARGHPGNPVPPPRRGHDAAR